VSKRILICLEDSHLGQQRQLLDALLRQVMSGSYLGLASYVMLSDAPADRRLWDRLQARARAERRGTVESAEPPPDALIDALDRQLAQAKFLRGSLSVLVTRPEAGMAAAEGGLEQAARVAMRQSDELHWWGEDRLCLVLPGCPGREATAVGNRMVAALEQRDTAPRLAFGAASYPYDALQAGSLLVIAADRMARSAPAPQIQRAQ
jgi:hypothetical protein